MNVQRNPIATGGCQCGVVRYALYVAPQNAHVCHCRMCQRATGGLFAALAGAPKAEFAWTKGEPGIFASSTLASRAYCRDCGTPLSFSYYLPEARFYVTIGSLDDPGAAPIGIQYGTESRITLGQFLRNYPRRSDRHGSKGGGFSRRHAQQSGLNPCAQAEAGREQVWGG